MLAHIIITRKLIFNSIDLSLPDVSVSLLRALPTGRKMGCLCKMNLLEGFWGTPERTPKILYRIRFQVLVLKVLPDVTFYIKEHYQPGEKLLVPGKWSSRKVFLRRCLTNMSLWWVCYEGQIMVLSTALPMLLFATKNINREGGIILFLGNISLQGF